MCNKIHVVFSVMVLCTLSIQCRAQGFSYSAYSNPYQNSFAFATPNLKQMFTTKLANAPVNQLGQQYQLQDQQFYNNFAQQQSFQFPEQQQNYNVPNGNVYSTAPQQFTSQDDQLRQQLAYLQLQQLQQQQQQQQQQQLQLQQQLQQQQRFEQFQQAPFFPNTREVNQPTAVNQQREEVRTQHLLGVAYSPSTKVSQVKFDSGKLKYDF